MTRKTTWLIVSCLMVATLLLVSCVPEAVEKEEELVSPEEEVVTEEEEEVAPALEEEAVTEEEAAPPVEEEETVPPEEEEQVAPPAPTVGELEVHFIDVGQGDSILVDLGKTEILIDGGGKSPGVTAYLNNYVDGQLEVVVATHPHADHIGGLIAVLDAFDVQEIWHNEDTSTSQTYAQFMVAVQAEGAEVHVARLHDIVQAGELELFVHHPAKLEGSTNNNSIVLHLVHGDVDFLFTGDAEHEAEANMMVLSSVRVPEVEILKVGHHGSRTASSEDFLRITSPEVAIYMAGTDNKYGHPHEETIVALTNVGAEIYGTDIHGTVVVTSDGETYGLQLEKQAPPVIKATEASLPPEESEEPAPTATPEEVKGEEPTEIMEAPQPIELITQHYAWVYGGQEWTWDVQIPQALYNYYQQLPRPPTEDYSVYVTHPMDDAYVNDLMNKIKDAAGQAGYDEFQTVEFAITFVQSLPYTPDSVTTPYDEYPRYPVETLVDNGGDCEDTSILMASLLDSMGYGIALILVPEHCAVGLLGGENIYGTYWEYEGGMYFYIETTNTGWGVGELPEEYADAIASVYGMVPTPILTHTWVATYEGTAAILEVTVENLGSAIADDVYVYAGFDAGEAMIWNPQESQPFVLPINGSITVRLILEIPLNEHTRLVVQIVDDGYAVETSYSEWFDT